MNEYTRRRARIEGVLRSSGDLSNNLIAERLSASVVVVRRVRRALEAKGTIATADRRMSLRGFYVDVSRVYEDVPGPRRATP